MAEIQSSFSHRKKSKTYVWPLIMWLGAADLARGETKVFFGEICLLALSWLLCENLLFCNRDTRGSERPTYYTLPLPSQSWRISKWSVAPVNSIQYKSVWLCFFDLLTEAYRCSFRNTFHSVSSYYYKTSPKKPCIKPLHSSPSLFQTRNGMFLHCRVVFCHLRQRVKNRVGGWILLWTPQLWENDFL